MSIPKLSADSLRSLARAVRHPLLWRCKTIGPQLRERIILRVSSVNRCVVCSSIHGAVARAVGVSQQQVGEARDPKQAPDDDRARLALRYAELRTAGMEADFPEEVACFEEAFSSLEREEIRVLVDLFTFNNRFNNTWESLLPGRGWRRRRAGMQR
jgi:AhpD family alkylhydroperoxidase